MERSFLLEASLNAAYNGIIVIDKESRIVFCNKAACDLIGVAEEEMLFQKIKKIIPNTKLEEILKKGTPELHQKHELSARQVISNRTPIFRNKKVIGAVAVFQDVTDLQQVLSELGDAKNTLQMLETGLEHVSDGIVMVDSKGFITMITESYCNFLGIHYEKAIGKHITEVIENTRMHEVIRKGRAEIGEIQNIKGKQVVVNRIPIIIQGEIVGGVGQVMFQEVSDLMKLVRRLNLAESKLAYYQQEYKRYQGAKYNLNNVIGSSENMNNVKCMVQKIAKYSSTVLIRGDSGTGKELFAHAIHDESPRRNGPFVRVNCAAIPKELLEAELFGFEEGSFTGAKKKGKPGKIEIAEGGTIFLDEIGDMPFEMQVKLLRFLQEKEVERIGGTRINIVNVRVIASTNRDVEKMIAEGSFREDLYYRLNVVSLRLPSLQEIKEDIKLLVSGIIEDLNEEFGTYIEGIASEVEEFFLRYHWPGNVRELKNVLERAVNVMDGAIVQMEDLPIYLQEMDCKKKNQNPLLKSLNEDIASKEKTAIINALKVSGYNKQKAAKLLSIHRTTLYRKLDKYKIPL